MLDNFETFSYVWSKMTERVFDVQKKRRVTRSENKFPICLRIILSFVVAHKVFKTVYKQEERKDAGLARELWL